MTPVWIILGLIIAATSVSALGAAFSIEGLGSLFSGAKLAVWIMAGSLEFAKFILAAYLHQRWSHLRLLFKSYLVSSVVILSLITSMGIFGFLTNAYQSASSALDSETIKLNSLKTQQANNAAEIIRLNKSVEEIPAARISKRIQARAEIEPAILELTKQTETFEKQITDSNLRILDVKQKVGPLIYISKAFNIDIDTVVKYLILLFVTVFDPLAICLVIATSEALDSRKNKTNQQVANNTFMANPDHPPVVTPVQPVASPQAIQPAPQINPAIPPQPVEATAEVVRQAVVQVNPPPVVKPEPDFDSTDEVVQMEFVDDQDKNGTAA
jgi:hypothetical protein